MPHYRDDDRVPPLKVMRKRLNGVYRADTGFSGPTRRYVLLVALLVGLASVPTLAAITAGSHQIADGKPDTLDIPVLPPASPGPVVEPTPSASASAGDVPPQSGLPPSAHGGSDGGDAAVRAGRLAGELGKRKSRPAEPPRSQGGSNDGSAARRPEDPSAIPVPPRTGPPPARAGLPPGRAGLPPSRAGLPPARAGLPSVGGRKAPTSDSDSSSGDAPSDSPDDSDNSDKSDWDDDSPPDPDEGPPAWATRPYCHERGKCGAPTHHHQPRPTPCEEKSSRRRKQNARHRSPDRSEHSRRSTVTERPRNVRPASILERSYAFAGAPGGHNRRHIPETRGEENQTNYRGAHRADQHHADDQTPAQRRSSRVGRHHAEHSEDLSGRW